MPGFELLLQARDAHLEELVEVAAEDREELRPLEQRERRVLGEREHARVELEQRQLAVEVAGRAGRGVVGVRVHRRMVGGPRAASRHGRRRRPREPAIGPGTVAVTNARPRLESTTFPPFARLALAHAIGMAGDVFVTVSLADTLFFNATTGRPGRRCCCTSC